MSSKFSGYGKKYLEEVDKNSELSGKSYHDKISLIIIGLLRNGLNKNSILEQLKDIDNIQEYVDKVEASLLKTLEN